MQFRWTDVASTWRRVSVWVVGLVSAVGLAGCFMPIEAEPEEENLPPLIDSENLSPPDQVVYVQRAGNEGPQVTLSAGLMDPNPEEKLWVAWVSESEQQFLDEGRVLLQDTQAPLYRFENAEITIFPCSRARTGRNEVITLVVADREFSDRGRTVSAFNVGPDGYLVTHSWFLEYQPNLCPR